MNNARIFPVFFCLLLLVACASRVGKPNRDLPARGAQPAQVAAAGRIDKFNRNFVCCKARADFEKEGYPSDFKRTWFIQEGKHLVNTMFFPLHDSSKNLMMLEVSGDKATFPLSITFMEKTAFAREVVSTMERFYHFSEDSTVSVICSYNGKRPLLCPVISIHACEYIAKTLLKNVLDRELLGGEG